MRIAQSALKTTIAAESGILLMAMPIPFIASVASLVIVAGWVAWKVIEHRDAINAMIS